jgi:hypothetical protein
MANENLIAYQQNVKDQNLERITALDNTVTSIDQAILQMNTNIDNYNAQKADIAQQKLSIEADNDLIDEIITILSQ